MTHDRRTSGPAGLGARSGRAWLEAVLAGAMLAGAVLAGAALAGACGPPAAAPGEPSPRAEAAPAGSPAADGAARAAPAGPGWLKGQLHLHSNASGDSETPPADVARWYAEHGYDFIVFTDHNRITEIDGPEGLLVFPGIELTQNLEHCEPPPEPGLSCLLHVNGLLVGTDTSAIASVPTPERPERQALYAHAMAVTEALGGVAMLNHPNFHYAADAALLSALAGQGLRMFELANEAVDSNNAGDAAHPSTEALWDAVLSTGARMWGVATDDAHHYDDAEAVRARGELAHVGDRGWVMVRAERDRASIRGALERGEFYASSGVLLSEVAFDGRALRVEVDEASPGPHRFVFIGDGGKVLDRQRGRAARYALPAEHRGYVRVRVADPRGHRAWTQPVWPE
ncbi:MAG: PHP domain-containing protein [Myxococcales bacterium]|nr:PHP domain-containing protein [Myxococcales bacterium]